MKPIPLIKRILYYVLLLGITLIGLLFAAFSGGREYGINYLLICVFFIPQYLFGLIFLQTKSIIRFIVPFATAIVSFGSIWLIREIKLFNIIDFDILFYILWIPIVITWEIAYQILKFCYNRTANQH